MIKKILIFIGLLIGIPLAIAIFFGAIAALWVFVAPVAFIVFFILFIYVLAFK